MYFWLLRRRPNETVIWFFRANYIERVYLLFVYIYNDKIPPSPFYYKGTIATIHNPCQFMIIQTDTNKQKLIK